MDVKPLENIKEGAPFFEVVHTTENFRHSFVLIFEVFAQSGVYILGVKSLEKFKENVFFFTVGNVVEKVYDIHMCGKFVCSHNVLLF